LIMSVPTLWQQLHHWRLGIADPQPLELPSNAVVNRRYKILCQLGQGSVERTYLAADALYKDSWCVLKEFVPRLLNPKALATGRERFEQEVSLLRDLEHPQLPEFREVLECRFEGLNRWIVVQEWLEGMSYHDLIKSRPFTEAEVIAFLQDILPALNYLHQQNPPVIHGNLSPETILQSTEMGKPILINFGTLKHIALCIADPYADPVPPRLRLYRPPEQLKEQLDPTTDLYALAVTVLTMLTGCPEPREFFDRRTQTWCWAEHVAVSVGLVVILDRMLHLDPTMRYQSGVEVQAALVAIHSRLPVPKPQAIALPQATQAQLSASDATPAPRLLAPSPGLAIGSAQLRRLAPDLVPVLSQVNQTVTVVVKQAGSLVVERLQRSGIEVQAQLKRLRHVPPQKAANLVLGTVVWLAVTGFVGLTVYAGVRMARFLRADPQARELAASMQASGVVPAPTASVFVRGRDLDRCGADLSRRFGRLEERTWAEVDLRFQDGFPGFSGPIQVNNPEHAFYLQEWCYLANQWLDQPGR
jgi:serine/threonine protein kinase